MRTLVTDGDQRPALAITRSLGRRGIRVLVGAEHGDEPRVVLQVLHRSTSPIRRPSGTRKRSSASCSASRAWSVDVILPVTDVTMHAVASNQDALRHTAPSPARRSRRSRSPPTSGRCAARRSVRRSGSPHVSRRRHCRICGTSLGIASSPAVVKPTRSRVRTSDGWVATGVHYAASREALCRLYRETELSRALSVADPAAHRGPRAGHLRPVRSRLSC